MSKYFKRAEIYLVGKQVTDEAEISRFLDDENASWITDTDNPSQRLPELAGRVCYMAFGDKQGRKENGPYLQNIIGVGHGSVLEHSVFNLMITGISRSLTHEFVRHRAGFGYSQLSQRYVDESDASFVIPPAIQGNEALEGKFKEFLEHARGVYGEMTDALAEQYATPPQLIDFVLREETLNPSGEGVFSFGEEVDGQDNLSKDDWIAAIGSSDIVRKYFKKKSIRGRRKTAREAARAVLPNATETKMFVTGNVRAWRHFIELRGDIHAEAEIRALACDVARLFKKEAPNMFGDYEIVTLPDGSERTRTTHRKV
ncbi:MAG: FAD-dependent thymidylate synthase [Planctomycetes bacterium]|nr:FAD-dependent thymidylate synthase [Planctomycetota bacterium]